MRRYYSGAWASIIWYIYLCLTPGWIFTVQPSLLFARVSNSIAGTEGVWTEGGMMGKKKRAVSPNWLGEVIEERLPQCMQKSLIFLCSLVWQLKRLEMTLSISQAHIGDIYKLTIANTQARRDAVHECACMLARTLHWGILQTPLLTAGILPPTLPLNGVGEKKKKKDFLLTVCFLFIQLACLL